MSNINNHLSNKLQKGIKTLGDTWVLCIAQALAKGERRFCEIQRAIPKMNPATLANRLKKLEKEKIIHRKEETIDKVSVVYGLTPKGKAILPIITSIQSFTDKFI